ncbi:xylulokinase [Candidatus Poribacteria bacterium]
MRYLIGIDVGTTGTKTILIDEQGNLVASSLEEYPLHTPRPKWAEQDPADWWRATANTIKNVIAESNVKPDDVCGVGLSGQMHGLVLIDKDYKVLRPAILWCDVRTTEQCNYITEKVGKELLVKSTCNPALEGFTAPKVIWVRDNEPEIYDRAFKMMLPKDYVRFRLTGELACEVSDAAGTILFDVRKREWSREVLDRLDISPDLMPECYESIDVCGTITSEVAEMTGLNPGTPVVGGGADNACTAVGNGIVVTGKTSASIGTSGTMLTPTDTAEVDPELRAHTFCHCVPNKWYIMGVTLSAGGSFRWLRDTLGDKEVEQAQKKGVDPYEILTEEAAQVDPGCEGLVFLPYLTGERTPHGDANAKGVFFGLTLRHGKEHMVRSVMEGVTYGMRDSLEIISGLGLDVGQITATGGGARSSLWRQMQADIYGAEVVTINIAEGPAFGAAILAGVGAGVYNSIEEATSEIVKVTSTTQPIEGNRKVYEEYYQTYRALYPALKPEFDRVSETVAKFSS